MNNWGEPFGVVYLVNYDSLFIAKLSNYDPLVRSDGSHTPFPYKFVPFFSPFLKSVQPTEVGSPLAFGGGNPPRKNHAEEERR